MTIDRKSKIKLEKEIGPLSFALFMQAARTAAGLTQEAFGKKLGLSRANICDIEKGRRLVSVEFALRVARKVQLSERIAVMACLQDQVRNAGYLAQIAVS